MNVSLLKMQFRKVPTKEVISYRDFRNHDNGNFIKSLNEVLNEYENQEHFSNDPDCFYKVCTWVVNQHGPSKEKNMFWE